MKFCKLKTKIEWYEVITVDFVADKEEVVLGLVAYVSSACINAGRFCGLSSLLSGPGRVLTIFDQKIFFQL